MLARFIATVLPFVLIIVPRTLHCAERLESVRTGGNLGEHLSDGRNVVQRLHALPAFAQFRAARTRFSKARLERKALQEHSGVALAHHEGRDFWRREFVAAVDLLYAIARLGDRNNAVRVRYGEGIRPRKLTYRFVTEALDSVGDTWSTLLTTGPPKVRIHDVGVGERHLSVVEAFVTMRGGGKDGKALATQANDTLRAVRDLDVAALRQLVIEAEAMNAQATADIGDIRQWRDTAREVSRLANMISHTSRVLAAETETTLKQIRGKADDIADRLNLRRTTILNELASRQIGRR